MTNSTLFQSIQFLKDGALVSGDILVVDGKIKQIAPSLPEHAETIIREPSLFLMPGVIDPHVHFRDPGVTWKEDLETGSKAAVSGGVTSFFEMPNTVPSTTSLERLADKKAIASAKSVANYNFFIGATPENIADCLAAENVPGIKIYVGSSTGSLLVDTSTLLDPFFKNANKLIAVHSEEETMVQAGAAACEGSQNVHDHYQKIRTVEAAVTCTKRLVDLAKKHNTRLHICHLTTAEEAALLAVEKPGSRITTEVMPQHLFLHAPDIYDRIGTFAQINPPIRESRHADALWKALKSGVIDCMGTDHAPHTIQEKEQPFGKAPSGMPGVDTSLPLMLNQVAKGQASLAEIQHWLCHQPANLFNIENKGFLQEGYDADLALVDLEKKWTISGKNSFSKCGWSAFDGTTVVGKPMMTFVQGHKVFHEGDIDDSVKGSEVKIKS